MQVPYRLFHINGGVVFQLMPGSISCDPLRCAELREEN